VKRISLTASITSSLVIDSLYRQASEEDTAVVISYCDYQERHQQTTTNMIGSILKQLVVKDDIIMGSVLKAFQKAKNECSGRRLCLPDLLGILKESIASLPQVFICIDALDELVAEELPELLLSLEGIVQEQPSVRVFLTGRPYVGTQIATHFTKAVTVKITPKQDDIRKYLQRKFKMDREPREMDDSLRTDIIETIRGSISQSFVRVTLDHTCMIIYFTNHHAQIPACFAKHPCHP